MCSVAVSEGYTFARSHSANLAYKVGLNKVVWEQLMIGHCVDKVNADARLQPSCQICHDRMPDALFFDDGMMPSVQFLRQWKHAMQ